MKREFDRYNIRSIHSVKNRSGCERVMGSWDPLNETCVIHEFADRGFAHGWTAPVRGAYFYWYVGSLFDYDNREYPGAAIGAVRIEHDPEYPEHPLMIPTEDSGIFYKELEMRPGEQEDLFYQRIKKAALRAAHDAFMGKASLHDMIYYDKKGNISDTAQSITDDIGYPPCHNCMPCSPELHKPQPFRIGR